MNGYFFLKASVQALITLGSSALKMRSRPSFFACSTISSRLTIKIYPLLSASCLALASAALGAAAARAIAAWVQQTTSAVSVKNAALMIPSNAKVQDSLSSRPVAARLFLFRSGKAERFDNFFFVFAHFQVMVPGDQGDFLSLG